jgi:hypothetical protein
VGVGCQVSRRRRDGHNREWVAHMLPPRPPKPPPEAAKTATAAPRRIARTPTHGHAATREAAAFA